MIKGNQFWQLLQIDDNNPEYYLYESLVEEFTQISGWPIKYYKKLPSEVLDNIYGEDPNSEYTDAYETKLVYEPTEETNILDSFGITSDETIQYMQIPKSMFANDIKEEYQEDYGTTEDIMPMAGDVIRTIGNNRLYEIVEVGAEQKIFQGRKMIWEFITRPYRYSEESTSAESMVFSTPEDGFPDTNEFTTTEQLSAYGDNEEIENESDNIENYDDIDSSYYGY